MSEADLKQQAEQRLGTEIEQTYLNCFIEYADEETIKKLEDFLDIRLNKSRTLEERRRLVKSYFIGFGKVSATMLKEMIQSYTGAEVECKFEPFDEAGNNMLYLNFQRGKEPTLYMSDINLLLSKKIPAHIKWRAAVTYRFPIGIVLLEILGRRIKDHRLFQLLREIINSEDTRFGLPAGVSPDECPEEDWLSDVGMPIGNLTSQLFANIYLNELDQLCKHELHLHYYIRYMDDVIILLPDKKELAKVKAIIEEFLNDYLHLDLNNKTAIRPCSLGVDFVGYHIWATHRKLKKQTARKIIHAVDWMCEQGEKGNMSKEKFERRVASYRGILLHCDSYGLRKKLNSIYFDHVVAEEPEQQETEQRPECSERKCYTCQYFHREFFCGYEACRCDIYGSLDVDQRERHPDRTAATCPDYTPNE